MIGTLMLARLRAALPLAVQAAGQAVLQQAQAQAALKSTTLARTLVLEQSESNSVSISTAHPYAQQLELGSAHQPPQPFLRPAVQAVLGTPARLYDQRPAMATFPFAVIDTLDARDASSKGLQATQITLQLQVFSRQRSGQDVRQILAVLRDVLHDSSPTLATGTLVRCQEEWAQTLFEPDANGTRGLARYRLLVSL